MRRCLTCLVARAYRDSDLVVKIGWNILTPAIVCVELCVVSVDAGDVPPKPVTSVIWQHVTAPNARYMVPPCPALGRDGTVYVFAHEKGSVHALFPDGSEKWRYNLGENDTWADVAIGRDGTIYVACRALYALNPDGSLKWKTPITKEPISSVAIGDNDEIYFVRYGKLCAANSEGTIKWERTTGFANFWFHPVIGSDGAIYVRGHEQGAINDRIHAFKPDGTLMWTFSMDKSHSEMAPALDDRDFLYFGSFEGDLYALNPQGALEWKFKTDGAVSTTPVIAEDRTIYVGCLDGCLYAVKSDGKLRWKFRTGDTVVSSPAIDRNGNIYFTSRDGNLYCLDPKGSPVSTLHFDRPRSGSPIIAPDGTIYLSEMDCLYAIRGSIPPSAGPWPMKRHDSQGTGRVVPRKTNAAIPGLALLTVINLRSEQ